MKAKQVLVLLVAVLFGAGYAVAQTEWTHHPDNPVLDTGPPGSWDDVARAALAVHFDGSVYHLWFMGNNSALEHGDIGHATSSDGVEWTMDPANPVLTLGEPGEWDDNWMFGAGLVHDGTQYHMWYTGRDTQTFTHQGGYATSPDGTVWTKHPDNPVLTPGPDCAWDNQNVYPHTVILENGTYRMWYSGIDGTIEQVGYAESTDGVDWTKHPDPVVEVGKYPGAWDSTTVGNPYVVFDGTSYHMWYTGGDGSTLSIGYAFSGDGIEWTKHGDSWVLRSSENLTFNSPVYFDGSTFHMWFSQASSGISPYRIGYATSEGGDVVPALDNWQIIPAAAVAEGSEGAFFQTDVDVSNADDMTAGYQFAWLPRGEDNSEPVVSETFNLGAGMSVRYANVLTEVFGLEPNSFGALLIKATTPDLLAMSRTYNLPSAKQAGTYGQAMPAVALGEFMEHGETLRLLFGSEHDELRTNVGCQSSTDSTTVVYLNLYDDKGTSLGRKTMTLRALGNDQLNRIFDGYQPVNGYVDVSVALTGNRVYCYGSVLDNVTSDPTTIPPQ